MTDPVLTCAVCPCRGTALHAELAVPLPVPAVCPRCPRSLSATRPALPKQLQPCFKSRLFPAQGIGVSRARWLRSSRGSGGGMRMGVRCHWMSLSPCGTGRAAGVALGMALGPCPCAEQPEGGGTGTCASLGQSLGKKNLRGATGHAACIF